MSQATRVSHAERTNLSDKKMLATAISLIVERGTDKTTLKDVGERAGYSRGLAGYRFGSKAGLFEFIVRSVGEQWLTDLKRVTEGRIGFEAMCRAIDEHRRFCIEASDALRAFYILWFESIGVQSPVKAVIASIHERRRRDVERWLAPLPASGLRAHPADIAGQFNATILGIAYQWLSEPASSELITNLHDELKRNVRFYFNEVPVGAERDSAQSNGIHT
ncbi:MAG: TetR/AcrR family transcriptional regulator [Pseudomonadota bacterium]